LTRINDRTKARPDHFQMQWQAIATAPFDRDLVLAVIDRGGVHALVFPCRRVLHGWIESGTQDRIEVYPTHWREWDAVNPLSSRPS
jgi:hypothetical protein